MDNKFESYIYALEEIGINVTICDMYDEGLVIIEYLQNSQDEFIQELYKKSITFFKQIENDIQTNKDTSDYAKLRILNHYLIHQVLFNLFLDEKTLNEFSEEQTEQFIFALIDAFYRCSSYLTYGKNFEYKFLNEVLYDKETYLDLKNLVSNKEELSIHGSTMSFLDDAYSRIFKLLVKCKYVKLSLDFYRKYSRSISTRFFIETLSENLDDNDINRLNRNETEFIVGEVNRNLKGDVSFTYSDEINSNNFGLKDIEKKYLQRTGMSRDEREKELMCESLINDFAKILYELKKDKLDGNNDYMFDGKHLYDSLMSYFPENYLDKNIDNDVFFKFIEEYCPNIYSSIDSDQKDTYNNVSFRSYLHLLDCNICDMPKSIKDGYNFFNNLTVEEFTNLEHAYTKSPSGNDRVLIRRNYFISNLYINCLIQFLKSISSDKNNARISKKEIIKELQHRIKRHTAQERDYKLLSMISCIEDMLIAFRNWNNNVCDIMGRNKIFVDKINARQNELDEEFANELIKANLRNLREEQIQDLCKSFLMNNGYNDLRAVRHVINDSDVDTVMISIQDYPDIVNIIAVNEYLFKPYKDLSTDVPFGDYTSFVVCAIKSIERLLKSKIVEYAIAKNKDVKSWNSELSLIDKGGQRPSFISYKKVWYANISDNSNFKSLSDKTSGNISTEIGPCVSFIDRNFQSLSKNGAENIFARNSNNSIMRCWVDKIRNVYLHTTDIKNLSEAKEILRETSYWFNEVVLTLKNKDEF